jgi:YVTN family beta-propeller protein
MKRKILSLAAVVLISYQVPLWAGNCPNPPPPFPDQSGNPLPIHWNADMCEDDMHWHYVIIDRWQIGPFTLGGTANEKNPNYDEDSGKPCCKKGEIVFMKSGMAQKAASGSDCPSNNKQSGAQNTAQSTASAPSMGAAASTAAASSMAVAQSVAAGPPPPLPYRTFAIPPTTFGSRPLTFKPQCNSAANPTAFHVVHLDNVVTRINQCTEATIAVINVPSNPLEVQVTPDAKWAIVTSYDNAISFIDTSNNTVAKVIHTDLNTFPSGVSISRDGSFALVTSYIDQNPALLVIDVQQQAIKGRFPLDLQYPQSVFLNPDATLAWVTYPFGSTVEVVDVLTGITSHSIVVPQPLDVVFNATGTVAYISSQGPGSVFVVDTGTYSVLQNIPTGLGASDLLLSPDGGILTVGNWTGNSISEIDTYGLTLIQTIPLGGGPIGFALVPIQ